MISILPYNVGKTFAHLRIMTNDLLTKVELSVLLFHPNTHATYNISHIPYSIPYCALICLFILCMHIYILQPFWAFRAPAVPVLCQRDSGTCTPHMVPITKLTISLLLPWPLLLLQFHQEQPCLQVIGCIKKRTWGSNNHLLWSSLCSAIFCCTFHWSGMHIWQCCTQKLACTSVPDNRRICGLLCSRKFLQTSELKPVFSKSPPIWMFLILYFHRDLIISKRQRNHPHDDSLVTNHKAS